MAFTILSNGDGTAYQLASNTQRQGQTFTAAESFSTLQIHCPSWSNNIGTLVLVLYTTIAKTTTLATQTFTNYVDNALLEFSCNIQSAGTYYLEWTTPNYADGVGAYGSASGVNAYVDGSAYLDGVAQSYDFYLAIQYVNTDVYIITAYPFSTPNVEYGTNTFETSTVTSAGTYYNYVTMTSQGYSTINSVTRQLDGTFLANIYINSYSLITRTGTYTTGVYTLSTTPNIRLYNVALGAYITIYNAALTTTVDDNLTGSITHSSTLNISIPESWFLAENNIWIFDTQQIVLVTNTGATATHTKTEGFFQVPNTYNIWVRYNDALVTAKNIWVRKDDALFVVKSLNVDYNGVIK